MDRNASVMHQAIDCYQLSASTGGVFRRSHLRCLIRRTLLPLMLDPLTGGSNL